MYYTSILEFFTGKKPTSTLGAPFSANALSPIETPSPALNALLNQDLVILLEKIQVFERQKSQARRVDGLIIGTGEADFTKGNTVYPLTYEGKRFQLIDVPGIEGDEGKYAHMVREAVAKAHLVFYVNGTNKKPEKATAQKIKDYLRFGTQVCPIVNVRGNADAYEFDEDRETLSNHGGCSTALEQTEEVLRSVLSSKAMQPGHCVQGLLAFSALAIEPASGLTTIDASRGKDLVIQQRNYRKYFESPEVMQQFSQISSIANVLHGKLATFREDMVESNKTKVHELLVENTKILQELHAKHSTFVSKTKPDFQKCREAVKDAQSHFEEVVLTSRKNLWDGFFIKIREDADIIVEEHYDDNDILSSKLTRAFQAHQEKLKSDLQEQFQKHLANLQQASLQAMQRLMEDVVRVEFEQRILDTSSQEIHYQDSDLDLGMNLGDIGKIAFNISSYAATGFAIGTAFPGIGNIVGAALGALVGLFASILQRAMGKEKRIRKAQQSVQNKLDTVQKDVQKTLQEERKTIFIGIRQMTDETVFSRIEKLEESLQRPLKIIEQQLALMMHTQNQLEKMPYGTVQAI